MARRVDETRSEGRSMENAALFARFEDVHAQYSRLREGIDELRHDLETMEIAVASHDGSVTVVVGPRGNLKQVTIAGNEELASAIMEAAQRAEAMVIESVQERIKRVAPEGGGLDQMLRRHDEQMGHGDGAEGAQRGTWVGSRPA